jgi:hypothetical protein
MLPKINSWGKHMRTYTEEAGEFTIEIVLDFSGGPDQTDPI